MYEIYLDDSAERFFKKLDSSEQLRISKKFDLLEKNPRLGKPLVGRLSGYWSLRVGKYRAIYRIIEERLIISVIDIGHRKNVYGGKE